MPSLLSLDAISRVRKTPPIAFERSATDHASIEGYCYEWGAVDEHGAYFVASGFGDSISVPVLSAHNHDLVIGSAQIEADARGLKTSIALDEPAQLRFDALSADMILPLGFTQARSKSSVDHWEMVAVSLVCAGKMGAVNRSVREPRLLKSKAELIDILREAGIPKAAAASIAARGWAGIASADQDAVADLAQRVSKFTQSIRSK